MQILILSGIVSLMEMIFLYYQSHLRLNLLLFFLIIGNHERKSLSAKIPETQSIGFLAILFNCLYLYWGKFTFQFIEFCQRTICSPAKYLFKFCRVTFSSRVASSNIFAAFVYCARSHWPGLLGYPFRIILNYTNPSGALA